MIIIHQIIGIGSKQIGYRADFGSIQTEIRTPVRIDLSTISDHKWLVEKKREGIRPSYGTFKNDEDQPWWEFKGGSLPLSECTIEVTYPVEGVKTGYRCSCSPSCPTIFVEDAIFDNSTQLKWRYVLPMNKYAGKRLQCTKPTTDNWNFLF